MNRRLLPILASTVLLVAGWTVLAFTCEDKAATAQSTTAKNADVKVADAKVADTQGKVCTAEMAAKCKNKTAKTTAVTASKSGHDCCAAKAKAAATTATRECSDHQKTTTTAFAKGDCGGAAMAGFSSGYDAVTTGGPGCSHGSMAMGEKGHSDCNACNDMAKYDEEIRAAGGQTQVVRLKNGVMFIHTADTPSHVHAVPASMMRRNERLMALSTAGDRAKLCPDCKSMRGAIASGKLNREFVTIEGGSLTLMTSNDRAIVAKLHALAGNEMARKS